MKKLYYYWFDDLIIKAGYFLEENVPLNNQEIIGDGFQKPILVNGVVVESITQEELDELNKPKVPESISQMKLRLQLIINNISIASIYAMIDGIEDIKQRESIYAKWEYAVIFDRQDTTLNSMAQMLGISQIELDQIFIDGNNL